MKVTEAKFVQDFIDLADEGYRMGWHERNGGNLSYRMKDHEVESVRSRFRFYGEWHPIGTSVPGLAGEYFLVTGTGQYFRNSSDSNKVVFVNKKLETRSVFKNGSGITLLEDGKTFFYIRNNNLYTLNGSKEDAEAVKLASDVNKFVVTSDGKIVFYMNEDDELVSQKGTDKPFKICDDVDEYMLFQGKTLFYLSDGTLYKSTGAKGEKVTVKGDVEDIGADRFFLSVTTDEDVTYISVDGKKFFYSYGED